MIHVKESIEDIEFGRLGGAEIANWRQYYSYIADSIGILSRIYWELDFWDLSFVSAFDGFVFNFASPLLIYLITWFLYKLHKTPSRSIIYIQNR